MYQSSACWFSGTQKSDFLMVLVSSCGYVSMIEIPLKVTVKAMVKVIIQVIIKAMVKAMVKTIDQVNLIITAIAKVIGNAIGVNAIRKVIGNAIGYLTIGQLRTFLRQNLSRQNLSRQDLSRQNLSRQYLSRQNLAKQNLSRQSFLRKLLTYVCLGLGVGLLSFGLSLHPVIKVVAQENSTNLPELSETLRIIRSPTPTPSNIDLDFVKLDGRKLFLVTALAINQEDNSQEVAIPIRQRVREIETALSKFVKSSFDPETLQVNYRILNGLPVIYADDRPLFTVTERDAAIYGIQPEERAAELVNLVRSALIRAHQERQPEFLERQGIIAVEIALGMIGLSLGLGFIQWRLKLRSKSQKAPSEITQDCSNQAFFPEQNQASISPTNLSTPLSGEPPSTRSESSLEENEENPEQHLIQAAQSQENTGRQRSLREIQQRLLQLGQLAIWGGGIYTILGLFPYTRSLQLLIIAVVQIPSQILLIALGTYLAIRLSAVIISRIMWAIEDSQLLTPEASKRLVLRISTFSQVLKRITALALMVSGTLIALSMIGIPVGPILAGAGIFGLALSFASQSVIKDAINGILILLEDQYGVGDVIVVGDLGGLVENMDLRITQLRDTEGSLITIPNGDIRAVKNLSKEWSRVDLNLFVDYTTDLNQAIQIIESTALKMSRDWHWKDTILEPPELLGVDDFGDRGIVIKLWIKTQPLKQWDVAREFRRRLKLAFDRSGIPIPLPQQEVRFKTPASGYTFGLVPPQDNPSDQAN